MEPGAEVCHVCWFPFSLLTCGGRNGPSPPRLTGLIQILISKDENFLITPVKFWQCPSWPRLVHVSITEPGEYTFSLVTWTKYAEWSRGASPKRSQEAITSQKGWILRRPKQKISTNCTEKISEEELYRLKIKIYIKYLPFRRILEKRKFLYLKNNEILTAEKHMIIWTMR